tara:strand:+ start:30712 stop:30882 length:171 start_codon:yes stop_codon:yes gene_type:complete
VAAVETTDEEDATGSNPTTAAEAAMTAEADEIASAPKETGGTGSGLVTGFVQSAAT